MTDGGEQFGLGVHPRILSKHTVDRFGHQDHVGTDLQRTLRCGGIRRKVRQPHAGTEDHHPSLLQVADGPQRQVRFGHLAHGDRGLDSGNDAFLLQEVLQCKAVHDSAEHSHIVRPGALHTELLQLCAPEKVAAADHDGDLDAAAHHIGDLAGHLRDDIGIQPDLASAEHFPAELEQHSRVPGQLSRRRGASARRLRLRSRRAGDIGLCHLTPRTTVPSRHHQDGISHPASIAALRRGRGALVTQQRGAGRGQARRLSQGVSIARATKLE
ncbi:Uncharacterised protein [Mycobacterium tuberculosis]|uniref:Uncharacterized protein n=1 Tax=Mycobacterium tuberculosis TaxID=1773 RepID=A0A655A7H5_MYCTX|nr:Uncharacterised protein [Mycobacterium tuberculosis]CNM34856.1 Uncharacterised protein [Mycobacterium tuberculosis]SGB49859.1 Uncharacterised protein [Mycobacterium tuberculosis]SGB58333.1 Uncharacterised protein [Mycobacterium tuberculosis]SGB59631.1 Uncharacterised protein [Mycobacterium tuberculosis]